jgi:hypothetical protein
MKKTLGLVAFSSKEFSFVSPFSPLSTCQGLVRSISKSSSPSRLFMPTRRSREHNVNRCSIASSPAKAHVQINEVPIVRISVCAGELCQCQGEKYEFTGGAADAAILELQSFDFSFPVDEVGCMVSHSPDVECQQPIRT